jgi:hypothetical protein
MNNVFVGFVKACGKGMYFSKGLEKYQKNPPFKRHWGFKVDFIKSTDWFNWICEKTYMHTVVKVNMKQLLTGTLVSVKAAFKVAVRPNMNPYLITNRERCV